MGTKINFDENWKFYKGDLSPKKNTDGWGGAKARAYFDGAAAFGFNDDEWRVLCLPHDYVSEGEYTSGFKSNDMTAIPEMESIDSRHIAGGSLAGAVAWYRKHFDIPAEKSDKRVYIYFDGIYRDSTVYLNEYYIGRHESGYGGFYYDITDFVNYGGENVIAVRVDSTGREGWWYEGGGIYRHTWLEYRDNLSVAPYGVFIKAAPDIKNMTATAEISAELQNYYTEAKCARVEFEIFNAAGETVSKTDAGISVGEYDSAKLSVTADMKNISLWDTDAPYLYTLAVRVYDGERPVDNEIVRFGIRDMCFDADSGFYLNGKHLRIQGVCLHHDHAGVGIAIPDSVNEYRINQMMKMGANAVRISHYPASPELLDICDRLGVLVFEEQRRMSSAPDDLESLRFMVRRDRNHPSIFLWGIGNEEIFSQDRRETERSTITIKMAVKKLDPTRPITSAVVCWNGKERFDTADKYVPVTENLDVMGFNYCRTAWDDYHKRVPNQPVIITEASSNSSTRSCYATDESVAHYYINDSDNINKIKSGQKGAKKDIAETEWKYFAERKYLSGIFIWTGIDYRGEPTPLTYPGVYSQFGITDYCAFPKDNFYYYKSWWQNEPVLHIFPHWNHNDKEVFTVYAYSNLDEAELFVNGKSYGKRRIEKNWYASWKNVVYEKGEATAVGYINGKEVMRKTVKTTQAAENIIAKPYKDTVTVGETAIINILITDKNGLIVPTACNELHFDIKGGVLLGTGNGDPGDHSNEKLAARKAFGGMCQLLVKATGNGMITVTASSAKLKEGKVTIAVK